MCITTKKEEKGFTFITCFNIHALLWPLSLSLFLFLAPYPEKVVQPCSTGSQKRFAYNSDSGISGISK